MGPKPGRRGGRPKRAPKRPPRARSWTSVRPALADAAEPRFGINWCRRDRCSSRSEPCEAGPFSSTPNETSTELPPQAYPKSSRVQANFDRSTTLGRNRANFGRGRRKSGRSRARPDRPNLADTEQFWPRSGQTWAIQAEPGGTRATFGRSTKLVRHRTSGRHRTYSDEIW